MEKVALAAGAQNLSAIYRSTNPGVQYDRVAARLVAPGADPNARYFSYMGAQVAFHWEGLCSAGTEVRLKADTSREVFAQGGFSDQLSHKSLCLINVRL